MSPIAILISFLVYTLLLFTVSWLTSRKNDNATFFLGNRQSPWYVVDADDKKRARLNCICHLLSKIEYRDVTRQEIELPPRQDDYGYIRPPLEEQTFVPEVY